ncbi:hypothetical protein NIES2101_09460 [Calothrix sp. HK-06]|nr:hypothetical protein NIES2101_09460 [Calothrix sp. HK-06]
MDAETIIPLKYSFQDSTFNPPQAEMDAETPCFRLLTYQDSEKQIWHGRQNRLLVKTKKINQLTVPYPKALLNKEFKVLAPVPVK